MNTPLLNIKLKNIVKFAKDNKLGEVTDISYRKNPSRNPSMYSYEPYSIEVKFTNTNGYTKGIVFSSHGIANIYDGKHYLYSTDSEERFSAENTELHPITIAWTKLVASESSSGSQIEDEIKYRRSLYAKADKTRSEVAALRSYYKNTYARLEDSGEENTRIGIQTKQLYDDYCQMSENLKANKSLQAKCIKALELRLEEIRESE